MGATRMKRAYRPMDVYRLPEPIPEVGLEAGASGVVDSVYDEGRRLRVDFSSPTPPSALVNIEILGDGTERVASYTPL